MLKIPGVYTIDGAKPPADLILFSILGNLGILVHFRRFPVYPD